MSEDWKISGKVTTIYGDNEHADGSLPLNESDFVYVSEWQAAGDDQETFKAYTNYMPISYALSQGEILDNPGLKDGQLYFNIIGYHNSYGENEILYSPIKLISVNSSIEFQYDNSIPSTYLGERLLLADGAPTLWGDYNFSNVSILIGNSQDGKVYHQKNVEIKGNYMGRKWNDDDSDRTIDYWHDSEHITYNQTAGENLVVGTVKFGKNKELKAELKNIADIDNTNSMLMPQVYVEGAPIYEQIKNMRFKFRLLLDDKLQPKGKNEATCIKAWVSKETGENS